MLLTWKITSTESAEQLEDFNSACALVLRISCTARLGVPVYFPSPHLSTDNPAMIAAAGTVKLQAGERAGFDLNADVTLRLQNVDYEDETLRQMGVRIDCERISHLRFDGGR